MCSLAKAVSKIIEIVAFPGLGTGIGPSLASIPARIKSEPPSTK